jgi:DNA-binding winged helix-turn-helix (wHTH) protein/Tol biopolymer transport system component
VREQLPSRASLRVTFGAFQADLSQRVLLKHGSKIKIQDLPFQLLLVLLETPGELVTREALRRRLWPADTFVSFDDGLNVAMQKLRGALGDNAEAPRYIETVPRQGYRFVAHVTGGEAAGFRGMAHTISIVRERGEESLSERGREPAGGESTRQKGVLGRRWRLLAVSCALLIAVSAGLFVLWHIGSRSPQVRSVIPLTQDGEPKWGRVVTAGSRVYFNEGNPGNWKIAEVSAEGGRTAQITTPISDLSVAGMNASGSQLLAFRGEGPSVALWTVPLPAGEPRRLEGIEAFDASMFPDGRIVYVQGDALYVAGKDGSNPRQLLHAGEKVLRPSVAADGTRIGFTVWPNGSPTGSLREAMSDGSEARELFKGQGACCGTWTADGKFLVFSVLRDGRWDLWALPKRSLLSRSPQPVPLTDGPLSYIAPVASQDGNHVIAIGSQSRSELVRYDAKSGRLASFLGGVSANEATMSRDGAWVAYLSYPDHALWRSRADGSERRQLTFPPVVVTYASISPDGSRVGFSTLEDEVYVIGVGGEQARKVAARAVGPHWSPDGNSLVYTSSAPGKVGTDRNSFRLEIADLRTGAIANVPGSDGLVGGFWTSPDTITAGSEDKTKFRQFSFRTQRWQDLASGWFVNWSVGADQQYLYCTTGGAEPKILRIRLADGTAETVTALNDLRRLVDTNTGTYLGVTAEGAPILSRDMGTQEIYALTVEWP